MKRFVIILISALFLLTHFVGCSSKGNFNVSDSYFESENTGYDKDIYLPSDTNASAPDISEELSSENDLGSRKIIKNANITFETKAYDEFIRSLKDKINVNGGYIQAQESRGEGVYETSVSRYSRLTVRIPAKSYNSFMESLQGLGSIVNINETQDDITMSYIDTESRIKALETEYDALITLLEKSESVRDIIDLQSRISEIIYKLDSYKSQLRKYDDLIEYCTVKIYVSEVERETQDIKVMSFGEKITSGLSNSLEDISKDLSDFAVWFIVSLPYILIWAVIIALIVIVLKFIFVKGKKKREIRKAAKAYKEYTKNEQN